ncbi:MAG: hypothetical protein AB8G22_09825 [Saprospiraceae bacterium]
MTKYFFSILLLFGLISTFACQQDKTTNEATETDSSLAEFEAFYDRFHLDSLYQMEHITFPLEGIPAQADSATLTDNAFRWQKDEWRMHRPFNRYDNNFQREFLPVGKTMIVEKITDAKTGFSMTRRFAKLDENWYLIYYAGMNMLVTG